MDKRQFITELQRNLTGKVSPEQLQELTRYYNTYIDSEVRKGKSEAAVLEALGSPRLLAKSIVDAEGIKTGQEPWEAERTYGRTAYDSAGADSAPEKGNFGRKLAHILLIIVVFLILGFILSVVFGIVGFVLKILFRFVLPFVIPLLIVWFVIRLWNNR